MHAVGPQITANPRHIRSGAGYFTRRECGGRRRQQRAAVKPAKRLVLEAGQGSKITTTPGPPPSASMPSQGEKRKG